jgi:GT2 family glycosyltransferase
MLSKELYSRIESIYPAAQTKWRGAVIILTFNQKQLPIDCINSLLPYLPSDIGVIFVDNHSEEDLAAYIKEKFPPVHCVRTVANVGYAGGNNIGALYAIERGAELLYFLNDDAIVKPYFWEECERWIHSKGAAIVGSLILRYNDPHLMQEAGVRFDGILRPTYRGVNKPYDTSVAGYYSCDAVCGAGFMVLANVFVSLGGFDEAFFLLMEETDLCLRARKAGFEVGIAGESLVVHKGAASLGILSNSFCYYAMRNHIWLGRRHIQSKSNYAIFLFRIILPRFLSRKIA